MSARVFARLSPLLLAAGLAGCSWGGTPSDTPAPQSCAELAKARAEARYEEAQAAQAAQGDGPFQNSALARDMAALDAEALRREEYERCIRLRGAPDDQGPPIQGPAEQSTVPLAGPPVAWYITGDTARDSML